MLNHDYAHCADFNEEKCPKNCFRAQLERDLKAHRKDYAHMWISYTNFNGEGLCQIDMESEE